MRRDFYSRGDDTQTVGGALEALPEFELTFLFSERPLPGRSPREVTILPRSDIEENYTEWITADASVAIDLAEVA